MYNPEDFFNYSFYYTPSGFAEENLNVSDGMGCVNSPSFFIDRQTFRNNLIMLVLDGVLHVEQYGRHYKLKKGECILMKLTDRHKYYSDKQRTAKVFWLHFRGQGTDAVIMQAGKYSKLPILLNDSDNRICSMLTEIFSVTKEQKSGFEADVSPLIYSVVNFVMSGVLKELLISPKTPAGETVHTVRGYIDEHICEELNLDTLAKAAGINKYHLCRLFKSQLGISPMNYVTRRKVEYSKKILEDSTCNITSISNMLSFADQSHFSKSFKAMTGLSPSQYRKMFLQKSF